MDAVADGWNNSDAAAAARRFAIDAVYLEPPDRQRYVGRQAIYEFFGGADPPPMTMTWHHLIFDADRQVGVGEYTFRGRNQYHGLVIVQVVDGEIARWREYQYRSDLDWTQFVGTSGF